MILFTYKVLFISGETMIKDFEVIKSKRKSAAIEITRDLKIKVRVPRYFTNKMIEDFVLRNEEWISSHYEIQKKKYELYGKDLDEEALYKKALEIIPGKVEYYSKIMGLEPSSVKITGAKTRFGSCSGKNGLCFSWRLMAYPEKAIDYVVVHELAHIRFHDHSKNFYALVEKYMPDYKERIDILRGKRDVC